MTRADWLGLLLVGLLLLPPAVATAWAMASQAPSGRRGGEETDG